MTPGEQRHALLNQLGVILGFVDIVLGETADDDARRSDLLEIRKAAVSALDIVSGERRPPSNEG